MTLSKEEIQALESSRDHLGKPIQAGMYLCLDVTDTGCGMDNETKRRFFEPFYTTKFTGRGLGMSAVLGILKAHNGALQLFSQPGKGTTVKVYLPVPTAATDGTESLQQTDPGAWRGNGTILLVEDEQQVKLVGKAMLQALGFTVIEAVNGEEALEQYRKNSADITIVVTDIGMPIMDGYELIHELKNLTPKLPIIISSGFGDTEVASRIARENIAGLICKPYNFLELREVVKSVAGRM
ncbi:MAG: response regulator [Desulfuromonadaceae bacterium]|nr:response regulator [Desulfuromonadaceae bacterium]